MTPPDAKLKAATLKVAPVSHLARAISNSSESTQLVLTKSIAMNLAIGDSNDNIVQRMQQQRQQRQHFQFQTAVYLNNAAVTFMTRNEHELALDTLNDALFLMECVVRSSLTMAATTTTVDNDSVVLVMDHDHALVQKATSRLAASSMRNDVVPRNGNIQVLSFTGAMDGDMLLPLGGDNDMDTKHKGWAICINDLSSTYAAIADHCPGSHADNAESTESMNEIVPAILLSNYALAHLHVDSNATSPSSSLELSTWSVKSPTALVQNALRLLDVGLTILIANHRIVDVSEGNMFVALTILNNICCVQQRLGHDQGVDGAGGAAADHFNPNLQLSQHQFALLQQMAGTLSNFTTLGLLSVAAAA